MSIADLRAIAPRGWSVTSKGFGEYAISRPGATEHKAKGLVYVGTIIKEYNGYIVYGTGSPTRVKSEAGVFSHLKKKTNPRCRHTEESIMKRRNKKRNPNELRIITDNRWKQFKYRYQVPKKVLRQQFDHLGEEDSSDGFFKYKNYWYHLSDFVTATPDLRALKWDGYAPNSYFSGVVIRVSRDGEEFQVGTYLS